MSLFFFGYNSLGLLINIINDLISNVSFNIKFLFSLFISNSLSDKSQLSVSKFSFVVNSFMFTNVCISFSLSFGHSILLSSNLLNSLSGFIGSSLGLFLSLFENFMLLFSFVLVQFCSIFLFSF